MKISDSSKNCFEPFVTFALAFGLLAGSHGTAFADSLTGWDAGTQLERDREAMERERILEQIAEDEAAKKNKVEKEEAPPADDSGTEISFELKQVRWNPSEILTQEEIQAVADAYIGRQIT